jgi:hypothetical protein
MSTQMSFFEPPRRHDGVTLKAYRPNGQEVPAHLPRLEEGAETMQARVLQWFKWQRIGAFSLVSDTPYFSQTPSDCAEGMGLPLTTVRPRICQLAKRTEGPRLELSDIPHRGGASGSSAGLLRQGRKVSIATCRGNSCQPRRGISEQARNAVPLWMPACGLPL